MLAGVGKAVGVVSSGNVARGPVAQIVGKRDVLGQPRGLFYIGATELWERISFHGMQSILVLYMVGQLLQPSHAAKVMGFAVFRGAIEAVTGALSPQSLAVQIFGLYIGLVYLMPVFGGLLGDRVLGRRRAVTLGALLITVGHFCLAFEAWFLVALLLLITGVGLLRGNLTSQVGDLYSTDDRRRETAFQLYYGALNMGAFIAPLISGLLAQAFGWRYGFGFAGLGMLLALVIYLSGARDLPPDSPRGPRVARTKLSAKERRVVLVMVLMLPVFTLFWIAQTQIWNTYNLWARDHVDLAIGHWSMPIPWLQAVDALGPVVLLPVILPFWRRQAQRSQEPDDFAKLGIGCLLFGGSMAWLAGGQLVADAADRVPLLWALAYHFLSAVGWFYFVPVAVAVFSRMAPASINAMMIGVYSTSVFAGSVISGSLGALYERISFAQFWLIHAAIVSFGGLLILLLASRLRREFMPAAI